VKSEAEIIYCKLTDYPVCPYCGEKEDEFGNIHIDNQQDGAHWNFHCQYCLKTSVVETQVRHYFSSKKAPCLNGENHDFKYKYSNVWRCTWCDEIDYRGDTRK
jgi:hypothetical protein